MEHLPFTENQHFKLFANCIPVKGISRSVVCDVQRRRFDFIPNELFDFLTEYDGANIATIREGFDKKSQSVINEYFSFLLEKNYIFFCEEIELDWFPKLEITWFSPSIIDNAIIDIDDQSQHDYKSIMDQLENLGCRAIELRFFSHISLEELNEILNLFANKAIEFVSLLIPFDLNVDIKVLKQLVEKFPTISSLIFHSVPEIKKKTIEKLREGTPEIIEFVTQVMDSSAHCGFISPIYFRVNIKSFSESHLYNNCLNKKISVDTNGDIKNCPALPTSFGNIKETTFEEALNIEGFKDLWTISKDQIEVCKTCEFRYICSDCRAFTQNPNNSYSKPLKCSYNPETMIWEGA